MLDDPFHLVDAAFGLGRLGGERRLAPLGLVGIAQRSDRPLLGIGGFAEPPFDLVDDLGGHLVERRVGLLDRAGDVLVGSVPDLLGFLPGGRGVSFGLIANPRCLGPRLLTLLGGGGPHRLRLLVESLGVGDDLFRLSLSGLERCVEDVFRLGAERLDLRLCLGRGLLSLGLEPGRDLLLLGQLCFLLGRLGAQPLHLGPHLGELDAGVLLGGDDIGLALLQLGGQAVELLDPIRRHLLRLALLRCCLATQLLDVESDFLIGCPFGFFGLLADPREDRLHPLLGIGDQLVGLSLCGGGLARRFEPVEIGLFTSPVGLVTNAGRRRFGARDDRIRLALSRGFELRRDVGGGDPVGIEQCNPLGEARLEGLGLLDVSRCLLHELGGF